MPIGFIAPGTIEKLRVEMEDRTGLIAELAGSGPTFTVKNEAGTDMVTDQAATASGMIIDCIVDTTDPTPWPEGEYRLFVKFSVGSEVPIKGPYYFMVSSI